MDKTVSMQQVHSASVIRVDKSNSGKIIPDCDGLLTNDPGITLLVRVADCLPISITDQKRRAIGLIHAGWRGLDQKILKIAVSKMTKEFGLVSSDLVVTIGPHICAKHYEVKSDVSSKFEDYKGALTRKAGKIYLDLAKIAALQLTGLGVKKENIIKDKRCTYEDANLFSYRRDKTDKRNIITLSLNIQSS